MKQDYASICKLRDVAIGPKKLRCSADYIRGKNLNFVLEVFKAQNGKSFELIAKATKSAVSNLEQKLKKEGKDLKTENYKLFIDTSVGSGRQRRYLPKAKGSAGVMVKGKSHITVILREIVNG